MNDIYVIKRSGSKELYDAEKIHEKTLLACQGLSGVSASDIEMGARLFITDGIKAKDIHTALINSAAEKISTDKPNYEYAAARLLNQQIRKEVYGQYTPFDFCSEIKKRVKEKLYDASILEDYTDDELQFYGSKIKYERDDTFTYIALSQLYSKYLIKRNNIVKETPQEVFMIMGMYVFAKEPDRKKWILEFYKAISNHEISLPTPIMNGLRTSYKRFVSCNVIDAGDTANSLALAAAFIMKMTANKSGIGISAAKIRGLGADIGGGRVKHTGVLPILKTYEKATSAFTQLGRGGSSNANYPWFHYEIELICQLGNAKGTEDTRVRHMDHTIIFNKFFLERALNHQDVTLFHMNTVPDLFESLGDYDKFKELYEKYEKSVPKKNKKVINAYDLLELFISERFLQGRVYCTFADNIDRGPWKQNDYITNLCVKGDTKITILDNNVEREIEIQELSDLDIRKLKILSYNIELKKNEFRDIKAFAMTSPKSKVLKITDDNGNTITCTPEHKIWTENRGYVMAKYLVETDILKIK